MRQYRYSLKIAGVPICFHTLLPLEVDEAFLPFLTEGEEPRFTAEFRRVDRLPRVPDAFTAADRAYRIHSDGVRSFVDTMDPGVVYAVERRRYDEGVISVEYLDSGGKLLSSMGNCMFHIGLESVMLRTDRIVFHAALVRTPLGGILFSGPSGIGKSTQAELWRVHRGGVQINGDRPILGKRDGVWTGWGSPYAGSSRCYVNDSCPIRAVVMLKQAKECTIRALSSREAFRQVYSGLTMNSWDPEFVSRACDLAMDLIGSVPVYELSCTPDEDAVRCLEQRLQEVALP